MRRLCLMPCFTALFLVAGVLNAPVPAQYHVDNTWGFKLKVPRGWREIPLKVNERWILAKYQSKQSYLNEEGIDYKAEMMIIVFPEERKKEKRTRKVETDGETVRVQFKTKYKDYKDYLKNTMVGGGYYFSKEDEGAIAGVKVSQCEIKVEKAAYWGKQRIVTWIYHLPDAELAVDFRVLENRYRKLKSSVYSSLKSFKLIERTGQAPGQGSGATIEVPTSDKWKKMSPIERMKFRKNRADQIAKKAIEALPDGWKHKESPHFTILTHVDSRYTKKVINQAEAIRNWLDKNLYEIGEEYVPKAILRICLDWDERKGYALGSGDAFSFDSREIVLAKKGVFSRKHEMESLSEGICMQWFSDKNSDLSIWDLPPWISRGLRQYVGTALCKGKKLIFKPDDWEKENLRKGRRENKLVSCLDLIKMTDEEYYKQLRKSDQALMSQAGSLVRYLMSSRCRKNKLTKDVIVIYLKHLNDVVTEVKKKEKKSGKKKEAKTAEEEQAQRKADKEGAKKRARHVLDETFKRTFGSWTDKDWAAFERGWAKVSL